MYRQEVFEETDLATLHGLIVENPLASVVTLNADGLNASHVPLVLYSNDGERGTLRGHIARANPQWSALQNDVDALCIFMGPQGYITPSWYATKQETGKVVPTWNYATVHAYGPLSVIKDRDWLLTNVNAVTDQHEAASGKDRWYVSDAPDRFIETMLRGIVGIEIPISRIEGKWKMSQNRPAEDRAGVVDGLHERGGHGDDEIASIVTARSR